jgi:hypothetical protein
MSVKISVNKKLAITVGLIGVIAVSVAASMPQQQQHEPPKLVNIKVFPKNVPYRVLDHQMDVWADALGVRCNFCHERNAQTGKMDFPGDAKPEKEMARHMFVMMGKINKKYFAAKKDSLGMMMITGINCNTCHHGVAHPDITEPKEHGPGPGSPGPGTPPQNGTPQHN